MYWNATVQYLSLYRAGEDTGVPQLDLIIDTYVHAPADIIASRVLDPSLVSRLWPQWSCRLSEDRGEQGVRWLLSDSRFVGSTEVWIEAIRTNGCVLHTYVRVDRVGRGWPAWSLGLRNRRLRAKMSPVLWRLKDDVETQVVKPGR